MKNRFVLLTVLLALALLSAACAAQDATSEAGDATMLPTLSTDVGTATEDAAEAAVSPTEAPEDGTATPEAGEADTTPTVVTSSRTPASDATAQPGVPQTGLGEAGLPDDVDELMRVLRTAGATVDLGDAVTNELVSVPGQILRINGEELQIFSYESAEVLEAQATQLTDDQDPEDEPEFYKLGTMLVRYAGRDPGVRDLLEDVLGAQAAGQ